MTTANERHAAERLAADLRDMDLRRINPDQKNGPRMRPVDAATLIVLDYSEGEPKILMGRRNAAVKFMPNKFVFPGGRVDPIDRTMPVAGILDLHVEERLCAGTPRITASRARALALTAIRETFEETGLLLGTKDHGGSDKSPNGTWQSFAQHGVLPRLDGMQFLARAITPPNRTRRFDTRFFTINANEIAHRIEKKPDSGDELTEINWIPLSQAKTLDVPGITLVILDELDRRLTAGLNVKNPVPFYRQLHGTYFRSEV